ncbi:hypothetical protein [uncultured Microbacterium sp.]|uniref:hypothetical protein n=1 Tax=uncultured Microbacterium sp. TaxID=191216 RepID=UPI0028DC05B0|nr:hypothetical protein [uncultured Microbacterium sp.]
MAAGDIETFHRNGIWFNRIEGEGGVIGSGYDSKDDAVIAGRGSASARQVKHIIRDEEGPSDDVSSVERHPRDRVGVPMGDEPPAL